MLAPALLVAIGGAVGAVLRYGLVALVRPHSPDFPAGTLACNLLGCAVIGLFAGWMSRWNTPGDTFRLLVLVGILGGFTTFSSLGLEVTEMLRAHRFGAAAGYLALSNLLGIGLALGAYALSARG